MSKDVQASAPESTVKVDGDKTVNPPTRLERSVN